MFTNSSALTQEQFYSHPVNTLDNVGFPGPDADPGHLKWATIHLWEDGSILSDEAIWWLTLFGELGSGWYYADPDAFMRGYVATQRSRAGGVA